MQHFFQSLLAKGHFPFEGLLRLLLKCVKHQNRISQLDEENGVRNSFPYLLLLFSGGETLKKLPGSFSWNYAS
jgi:hypothetical protein